ncbi:MAG TPA: hypothetical protein VK444_07095 [Methanobacteriaceae archaeon]|nr:hypothetical protein [Methanobacteriaceae archaeon]
MELCSAWVQIPVPALQLSTRKLAGIVKIEKSGVLEKFQKINPRRLN